MILVRLSAVRWFISTTRSWPRCWARSMMPRVSRSGAFAATLVAFFLAEIGDKTQIATIGLAARFGQFYPVVIGTTLGMMLANIPVVAIGDRIAGRLPVKAIRLVAAAVFACWAC